jgi:hypothetical protein
MVVAYQMQKVVAYQMQIGGLSDADSARNPPPQQAPPTP